MKCILSAIVLGLGLVANIALADAKACTDPARALGVSRVVEIDTSAGPRYGHQQYPDIDFLADGEIVLTFDDGPLRPYTRPIVDALEAACTKATFFMVGQMALADPEMVKEIHRKGHTVGTHTQTHANLKKLTPLAARREIELGFSSVQAALGQPIAPFFRFPFLADPKSMIGYAQTRQFGIFSIDADSYDYKSKDPAAVHQAILSQIGAKRKGIILFHDIQEASARALPGLLAALKAKGFKVVHLKAKAPAQTLPEFDSIARKENGAKRVASAANPLAERAVTWPVAPGQRPLPPVGSAGQALPSGPPPPPIQQSLPPPIAIAPPPPPRVPRARPERDWRDSILRGN